MKCPDCSKTLRNETRCPCGWRMSRDENLGTYPTLNDFKLKFEAKIKKHRATFTVDWFLSLVEQPRPEEAPKVVMRKDSSRWEWPYEDRIFYLFRKYLKCDEKFKRYIIAAREDNIFWRGDSPKFFYIFVLEVERMRKIGVEEYRQESLTKLKDLNLSA